MYYPTPLSKIKNLFPQLPKKLPPTKPQLPISLKTTSTIKKTTSPKNTPPSQNNYIPHPNKKNSKKLS